MLLLEDLVSFNRSAENDRIRRTWWRIRGRLDSGKLGNVHGQTEGHLQLVAGAGPVNGLAKTILVNSYFPIPAQFHPLDTRL